MGLFDGIFGNVDFSPLNKANLATQASYPKAATDIKSGVSQATGTLTDAQKQAIAAQQQAAQQAQGYLGGALPQGMSYLQQGLTGGLNALDPSMAAYKQLFGTGTQGIDMYGKLLGLGPDGSAGIQEALTATPGYQFARDQGITALDRTAAATGRYNPSDVMQFGTGLAGQTYQNILGDFSPYFGLGTTGAAGMAGVGGQEANLFSGFGQNAANLATGTAGQQASVAENLGSNLSNIIEGTAGRVSGMQSGQGTQLAGLDLSKAQSLADFMGQKFTGQQTADQNAMNFWGNLLKSGASMAGMAMV